MYQSRTVTATATQAKRLAARIGTELLQVQAAYGEPDDAKIGKLMREAELYLAAGYLGSVSYGFKRGGRVVFELSYTAAEATGNDEKPGRIPMTGDLSGVSWFSYLTGNDKWKRLTGAEQEAFYASLPLRRSSGDAPVAAAGLRSSGQKVFSEDTLGLRRDVRCV